jgi:hypothetical protein
MKKRENIGGLLLGKHRPVDASIFHCCPHDGRMSPHSSRNAGGRVIAREPSAESRRCSLPPRAGRMALGAIVRVKKLFTAAGVRVDCE